jgi:hypothetical protein
MLTQDQLTQLEPLTKHQKFGKLLSDAIEIWKREDVTPVCGKLGISKKYSLFSCKYEFNNVNKCCCLIGAAMLGKNMRGEGRARRSCTAYNSAEKEFNITFNEVQGLWKSFDGWNKDVYDGYEDIEAIEFANAVRKIIKPVSDESHFSK